MSFNIEKLKSMARPLTEEEKSNLDFLSENSEWLRISASIALKIRKTLRIKGMSQAELASKLSVSPAQISKLLSGKVNFELKTIAKLQKALGEPILEINLSDKQTESTDDNIDAPVVMVTHFVKSSPIISNQRVGDQSYFSGYNIMG